jgi:hypothetical protein
LARIRCQPRVIIGLKLRHDIGDERADTVRRTRNDTDDEWRKRNTVLLGRDTPLIFARMRLGVDVGENLARALAPLSLEEDKTPGRELSMIRHPRRDREERLGFLGCGAGPNIAAGGAERLARSNAMVSFIGGSCFPDYDPISDNGRIQHCTCRGLWRVPHHRSKNHIVGSKFGAPKFNHRFPISQTQLRRGPIATKTSICESIKDGASAHILLSELATHAEKRIKFNKLLATLPT